ncbi:MAG: hypothetical protein FXF47_03950 [Candidatus Mcinerneyibacterium aminivorans]|uniref:Uncharacterized protein n=1 Tax=Candidatus Mcinerneyibacterium aminivorans TaxID=2703815 RepID=A0A5D0MJU7_9BACT|nr:MAG: hypothetical protein FXF47_03950 [Candidatus Mcinerneyibacterium aminivorans]
MPQSDFKLTSIVRRIIVQMNIDINQLNISVINGVAYLDGKITKTDPHIRKMKNEYSYDNAVLEKKLEKEYKNTLKMMDRNIINAPGVRGAVYKFEKWEKTSAGGWIKKPD